MANEPLSVEINSKKLEDAIRFFPKQLKINLGDGFDHIRRHFLKEFRAKRLSGQFGDEGVKGSANFFRQFKSVFLVPAGGDINNMGIEIFTESKVARIQETGGIETSKKGGRLSVPFSQSRVGELYTGSGRLKSQYKRARSLKGTFRISAGGHQFIFRRIRGRKSLLPVYHLEGQVKMKPRLGFMKTWDEQTNWRLERLNKAINKTLTEV